MFEWLNEADNGQWLMVLDNADDLDTFFAKTTSTGADNQRTMPFIDYLPRSSRGLMLITTRDARISRRLGGRDTSIVVEAMLPLEAQDLLRSRSERPISDNDDNSRTLVDELAYIPLAITQAAAFISENEISLADYLEILRTGDSDLQDLLDEDLGDLRRDSESQNSVIRTWKISFDLISKQNPRAAEMLSLMAVLDRQAIPKSLLQNHTDRKTDFVTARGILQKFSLISTEDGGSKYELHRLVQLATRRWLELQGKKEEWQGKALLVIAHEFPAGEFRNWTTCELLWPHAQTVTQYVNVAEAGPFHFTLLLGNMADFDMEQGRIESAHTRASAALEVHKTFSGLEHPFKSLSMSNLALTLFSQRRLDEAQKLQEQVMERSLRVLKEEHPFTLYIMAALAVTYREQERWDEARMLQVRVVETRLRVLPEGHPDTLSSISILAATYKGQGYFDEAEKLWVDVIERQENLLTEEHPETLKSMIRLALMYVKQRRWDEAEKLQKRVIGIHTRMLEEEHPITLERMFFLATIYRGQERWVEAEELEKHVLEIKSRVLKKEHPTTLDSMDHLAAKLTLQSRLDEAAKLLVQVVEIRKRVFKEEHPDTLNSMLMLGVIYSRQRRWDEAMELLQVVFKVRTKTLGIIHPDTLDALKYLDDCSRLSQSHQTID